MKKKKDVRAVGVKPEDVRAVREFLRKRGIRGVSARKFALSSLETGKNFRQLLEFLQGVRDKANGTNSSTTVR